MSEELKTWVVEQLVEQHNRSDIIAAVCERTGMDWPHCEELVNQVEKERAHAIAAGQMPILVFLAACTSAAGAVLLAFSVQTIMQIANANLVALILVLAGSFHPLWTGIFGLAMMAGGGIGMYKAVLRYYET